LETRLHNLARVCTLNILYLSTLSFHLFIFPEFYLSRIYNAVYNYNWTTAACQVSFLFIYIFTLHVQSLFYLFILLHCMSSLFFIYFYFYTACQVLSTHESALFFFFGKRGHESALRNSFVWLQFFCFLNFFRTNERKFKTRALYWNLAMKSHSSLTGKFEEYGTNSIDLFLCQISRFTAPIDVSKKSKV